MPQFESAAPAATAPSPAAEAPAPPSAPPPEPAAGEPPAEATAETPAESTEAEAPSFGSIESAVEEIKKLRSENARRRVENKELNEVFEKFGSPEEKEAVLKLAEQIATDPLAAEQRLTTILNRIREIKGEPEPAEDAADEIVSGTDEDDEPRALTPEDVERLVEERLAAAEEERQIQAFVKQAEDLGYPKDSAEYGMLLHYAAEADLKGNADPLGTAHAKIQERENALKAEAIEEYKRSVAEGRPMTINTGTSVSPPSPTTVLEETSGDLKDWGAARKRAEARLRGTAPAA